jgi:hypothetical protein
MLCYAMLCEADAPAELSPPTTALCAASSAFASGSAVPVSRDRRSRDPRRRLPHGDGRGFVVRAQHGSASPTREPTTGPAHACPRVVRDHAATPEPARRSRGHRSCPAHGCGAGAAGVLGREDAQAVHALRRHEPHGAPAGDLRLAHAPPRVSTLRAPRRACLLQQPARPTPRGPTPQSDLALLLSSSPPQVLLDYSGGGGGGPPFHILRNGTTVLACLFYHSSSLPSTTLMACLSLAARVAACDPPGGVPASQVSRDDPRYPKDAYKQYCCPCQSCDECGPLGVPCCDP